MFMDKGTFLKAMIAAARTCEAKLDELGSVQWPCNEKAPEGTPIMHIGGFARVGVSGGGDRSE